MDVERLVSKREDAVSSSVENIIPCLDCSQEFPTCQPIVFETNVAGGANRSQPRVWCYFSPAEGSCPGATEKPPSRED
ncbi:hypothetical protein TNCV_2655171 [Trichonephila clavipes]|nr:hypothetical protein TNCV_2655171 [Trichonephila clavipes]